MSHSTYGIVYDIYSALFSEICADNVIRDVKNPITSTDIEV